MAIPGIFGINIAMVVAVVVEAVVCCWALPRLEQMTVIEWWTREMIATCASEIANRQTGGLYGGH
jgi:hypothetical protein